MVSSSDLEALYPFLHGKAHDPAALDAALLHSVQEKARESRKTNNLFFGEQAGALVAAARALDRILLWNFYVVPQWSYNKQRTARWDRFSHADPLPKYGISAFPSLWWWDADKAAKVGAQQ